MNRIAAGRAALVGLGPALALTSLALVNETDQAAYGLLGPEIVRTFHISPATFGLASVPIVLLGLVLPTAIGWLSDHTNRVRLSVIGGAVWLVFSVLTGIVPAFAIFVAARVLAAVGRSVSGPVHNSLLADSYSVERRGLAFSLHQNAQPLGELAGLLAGGAIAAAWRWQVAFIAMPLFAIPALYWVSRQRDPRPASDTPDAPAIEHVRVRDALRLLQNVVAFRRYAVVWFLLAVGYAMSSVYSFYFSAVFGIGAFGRACILGAAAALSVVGAITGGRIGQRLLAEGRTKPLGDLLGVSIAGFVLTLVLSAFAPTSWFAAAVVIVSSPLRAVAAVPVLLVLSATIPPRIRGVAFGALTTYFALGLLALPVALAYGDKYSYRVSLLVGVVPVGIAGILAFVTSKHIAADAARAARVTELEARLDRTGDSSAGALEVDGLDVRYGSVQVLFDVSLRVEPGEMVALLGTNGAGKSTLLKAVCGLIRPSAGAVLFDGRDISGLDAETIAARGLCLVPGGRGVFPGLSVERNLRLGTWLYRKDAVAGADALEQVLDLFPRLGQRLHQLAGTLSGGEQQMLTLAQAFVARPRILAIDELSLGLAPRVVEELLTVVETINATGVTVILVEQSVNIALSLTSRALFMEKGEVRYEGASADLLERDDLVRSVFLSQATVGVLA
jgi:branched-chain amino acid transport system ATP-binding protein